MAGIADFLDSLIGGFDLICFCLVVGGLFWGLFILRPWQQQNSYNSELLQATVSLIYKGGFWLAAAQAFKIILKIWLMNALLDKWPFPEFAGTTQFIGGLVRTLLVLLVAGYCYVVLRQNPDSKQRWLTANLLALPMIISGAWLVHGAGRFENQLFLMSFTVLHQVAAAVWIGSVFQLVNLWLLRYRRKVPETLWPQLLRTFSPYGIAAVAAILLSGLPIALQYIDSINGLFGPGAGDRLTVKVILLVMPLGYAW